MSFHLLVAPSGHESDSVGSTADSVQERADTCHQKEHNQSLLDKLTQEKLDSKAKLGSKRNDLSSGMAEAACSKINSPSFSSVISVCVCVFSFIYDPHYFIVECLFFFFHNNTLSFYFNIYVIDLAHSS